MGQRQPADPPRPLAAADPDEGPRGIQGEAERERTIEQVCVL